ncbi:MAG: Ig-like domain-containing protein, partial [Propionibacteriaceae bacterium]|nr:Ig-like domain-containing protein [Propionibacteriaceae bacterium]
MKNRFARRLIAGLAGAGLAIGGLVAPAALPPAMAEDVSLSSLTVDNTYSDIMYAPDGQTPLDVDNSTTNNIVPSGGTAKWAVTFTPSEAGSVTLTATLPAGNRFDSAAVIASCPGTGSVSAAGNVATCQVDAATPDTQQWNLSATVSGANGSDLKLNVTGGGMEANSSPLVFYGVPRFNIMASYTNTKAVASADGVAIGLSVYVWAPIDPVNGLKGLEPLADSFDIKIKALNLPASWTLLRAGTGGNSNLPSTTSGLPGAGPQTTGTGPANVTNTGHLVATVVDKDQGIVNVNVSGADTTAIRYPTQDGNGTALPKDMAFVVAFPMQFFVPAADIPVGSSTNNIQVVEFDPSSLSGQSNYGDLIAPNQQPGAALLPFANINNTPTANGVSVGLSNNPDAALNTVSGVSYFFPGTTTVFPEWSTGTTGTGPLYGDQEFDINSLSVSNNSPAGVPITGIVQCMVWDPSLVSLRGPATSYSATYPLDVIEYGVITYSGAMVAGTATDHCGMPDDNSPDFFDTLAAAEAYAATQGGQVNALRMRTATTMNTGGSTNLARIPMVRSASPSSVAPGTHIPLSFALGQTSNGYYIKSLIQQAFVADVRLDSTVSISGAAAGVASIQPGQTQVVTVQPTATAPYSSATLSLDNVTVSVTVPKTLTVTGGTAQSGGAPAEYSAVTDDQGTTLTFKLGTVTAGQALPPLSFEVVGATRVAMPTSTAQVTSVMASNPANGQDVKYRTAGASFVVNAPSIFGFGMAQSTAALFPGISQHYDISIYNTASTDVTGLSGAIVLPFNGDGRGTENLTSAMVLATATWPSGAPPLVLYRTANPASTMLADVQQRANAGTDVLGTGLEALKWKPSGSLSPVSATGIGWHIDTVAGGTTAGIYTISITLSDLEFSQPTGALGMDITGLVYTPDGSMAQGRVGQSLKKATFSSAGVAGTVYQDTNFSGTLDAGDQNLAGQTVTLSGYSFSSDGADNNAALTADDLAAGAATLEGDDVWWPSATVTTGTDGKYSFATLPAGRWVLTTTPAIPGVGFVPNADAPLTVFTTHVQPVDDSDDLVTVQNLGFIQLTAPTLPNLTVNPVPQDTPVKVQAAGVWDTHAVYTTTATVTGGATTGTASLNPATGELTFTPNPTFHGTATITYSATDQAGQQATAAVTVQVVAAPTLTVASPDTAKITVTGTAVFDNRFTYEKVDELNLAKCTASVSPTGSASVDATGKVTFASTTPGTYTIQVTCQDDMGTPAGPVTNTVTVVTPPTLTAANPANITVLEGQTVQFANQLTIDTANGVQPASCDIVSTPASGATVSPTGLVEYQNAVSGTYVFVVTCTDSMGQQAASVTNTVTVTHAELTLDAWAVQTTGATSRPVPGDQVTWTFRVINTGTAAVHNLAVAGATCDDTVLQPGETTLCTTTSQLTQADLDAGTVTSAEVTATALAFSHAGDQPVESNSVTNQFRPTQVALADVSQAFDLADLNGNNLGDPGETIDVTITVTNLGNVTLHDVAAAGDWGGQCAQATLAPGEVLQCATSHVVANEDVTGVNPLVNTVTVTALTPQNATVDASHQKTVPLNYLDLPTLAQVDWTTPLAQGASGTLDVKTGGTWDDNATYTTSASVDGGAAVGTASLDADGILTFTPDTDFAGEATIHYTITDQAGQSSTATVTVLVLAKPIVANLEVTMGVNQNTTIDVLASAQLDAASTYFVTAGNPAHGTAAVVGSQIVYTPDDDWTGADQFAYTITDRAGQQSSATITVKVAAAPTLVVADPATLTVLVGQTAVFNNTLTVDGTFGVTPAGCTISPAVTGATISNDGRVTFQATTPGDFEIVFTCQDSLGQQTPEVTNKVHVPATGLDLQVSAELTAGDPAKPMAGDVVTWTYTLDNTGQALITDLAITGGSGAVGAVNCPVDQLAGGESTICTGTMVLTQADIDAGLVSLLGAQAKVVAYSDVDPLEVISNYVTMSFELTQVGSSTTSLTATLDDTNGNELGDPGETITYETVVENTGNVTLRDVQVTGDTLACQPVTLAPGETTTCTGQYVITAADVLGVSPLTNTAQSTASTPAGQTVTSTSETTWIDLN